MPIYEFQCDECGHCFEVLVMRKEDAPGKCPACGKEAVRRKMSAACTPGMSKGESCAPGGKSGFS